MNLIEAIGLVSAIVGLISFAWWLYEKWLPHQRISWRRAERYAVKVADKLIAEKYTPTLILGIGRGGAIFGALISGALGHCPLIVIDRKYEWSERGRSDDMMFSTKIPLEYIERVLLVAGEAHSGGTMRCYYNYLLGIGASEIRRAVLFLEEDCPVPIEYFGVKSDKKGTRLPWMFSERYLRGDRSSNAVPTPRAPFRVRAILIRHAEAYSGEDIFAGRTDSDLTVRGVEQAVGAGQELWTNHIQCIYTSPLGRAQKTAKIINSFLDAEYIVDERLREIDFGLWDGRPRSEVIQKYADEYAKREANPVTNVPEGGEDPALVLARLQSFFADLAQRYQHSDNIEVAIVSHKTAIRLFVTHVEQGNLANYRSLRVDNAQAIVLLCDHKGRWSVDGDLLS